MQASCIRSCLRLWCTLLLILGAGTGSRRLARPRETLASEQPHERALPTGLNSRGGRGELMLFWHLIRTRDYVPAHPVSQRLLTWIENHQALASWVEALGVFIAIWGSVSTARWQDKKTHRREREQQTKKGKSVVGCFVPILKIIEYDVREMAATYRRARTATVQELRQCRFRELPASVSFVLENAHLLPGEAIISVPQLLSLRDLAKNDIETVSGRRRPEDVLSTAELTTILSWLDMMQSLIDEIYRFLERFHDAPITKLLKEDIT
jgi:hypothetical protein